AAAPEIAPALEHGPETLSPAARAQRLDDVRGEQDDPPPPRAERAERREPLADLDRVADAVVQSGGRALPAGRDGDLVPEPRGGHHEVPVAGAAGAQRPVHVLRIEEELRVEETDLLEDFPRHQH